MLRLWFFFSCAAWFWLWILLRLSDLSSRSWNRCHVRCHAMKYMDTLDMFLWEVLDGVGISESDVEKSLKRHIPATTLNHWWWFSSLRLTYCQIFKHLQIWFSRRPQYVFTNGLLRCDKAQIENCNDNKWCTKLVQNCTDEHEQHLNNHETP